MHRSKLLEGKARAKREGWSDWIKSANDEAALVAGYRFDYKRAWHAVDFYQKFLTHHKPPAAGELFVLEPWQRDDVIAPIFGWVDEDGYRRTRITYLEVPKKNGKSALTSGAVLYCHAGEGEPGPESYCAGTDQKSAMIVYREIAAMVRSSAALRKKLHVKHSLCVIENKGAPECFIRPLSRETHNAEGANIHIAAIDELHLWKDREFYHILRYGGRARKQPLLWQITTAGKDLTSICYEEHDYAMDVQSDRIIDTRYFPYIRGAAPGDDWTSPEVHAKANPSYGSIINPKDMTDECRRAVNKPSERANFKRRCLNIWGEAEDRFFDMIKFLACDLQVDVSGREPVGSLDLSSSKDTSSFTLTFPPLAEAPSKEDPIPQITFYWLPEARISEEGEKEDKAPYRQWFEEGWIRSTPGEFIDIEQIFKDLLELRDIFNFNRIVLDRSMAMHLMVKLEREGFEVIVWPQGYNGMSWPMRYMEELVSRQHITHFGNPIDIWQADKVKAKMNATGQIMPVKRTARGRIDGPVTKIMGVGALFAVDPDELSPPTIDSVGGGAA